MREVPDAIEMRIGGGQRSVLAVKPAVGRAAGRRAASSAAAIG
jgi:hypothetical protein